VLAAIHGLDEDFEIGKVSEADHREMRQTLRAEAVELLRTERAALAAASHPDSATRSCPRCDTEAGAEARFCSQCGTPLDDNQTTGEISRA
jgi:membrane protease subunit (stomatin/prohibitin family)